MTGVPAGQADLPAGQADLPAGQADLPAGQATIDLTGLTVFRSAVAVRDQVSIEIHGQRYAISPVSAGFLSLTTHRTEVRPVTAVPVEEVAADAVRMGRPVALVGDAAAATAARVAAGTESHWVRSRSPGDETHFLMSADFVRHRRTAIERRQSASTSTDHSWCQQITAVGVGPRPFGDPGCLRDILNRSDAIVTTDWTCQNTLPSLLPWPGKPCHVVPYHLSDYDTTIAQVNRMLDRARADGARDVALLIEGNPDTYDVLDGVDLTGRRLRVHPGVPIALLAAADFASGLQTNPFTTRLAYLSGLPFRHDQSSTELLKELTRYLETGVGCVLVEMTFGELSVALEAVRAATVAKMVVLLTDCYTPAARTTVASARSNQETHAVLDHARGKLSTLLIFDDPAGDAPLLR